MKEELKEIVPIGKAIKRIREDGLMTQEALCKAAQVSYSVLTKVESGVIKEPSYRFIEKILDYLGYGINRFRELRYGHDYVNIASTVGLGKTMKQCRYCGKLTEFREYTDVEVNPTIQEGATPTKYGI